MKLIIEHRQGLKATIDEIANPSLPQIQEALDRLDGKSRSLIALETDDQRTMIGGGPDAFVCSGEDAVNIVNVLSQGSPDDFIELMVGGQYSDYPSSYILDKPTVERVATALMQGQRLQEVATLQCEVVRK